MLTYFLYTPNMVMIIRASRSGTGSEEPGPSETKICDWIEATVSVTIREIIT